MNDDGQLLRSYVNEGSQTAFTELVSRHLGLVYHAAARELGDHRHLAGDVAQQVFLALASKARSLGQHPSVAGWLHTTTHFKVREMRRAENRRRARENLAMVTDDSAHDDEWRRIQPVLDETLRQLSDADREAVLLRYFEGRAFPEIATTLEVGEAAARKRVERGLEKLRLALESRGIRSTASAFSLVLATNAAHAAPTGLAGSIATTVLATPAPAAATWALPFMSMSKPAAASLAALLIAVGFATYETRRLQQFDAQASTLTAPRSSAASIASLRPVSSAKTAATTNSSASRSSLPDGNPLLKRHPQLRAALFEAMRTSFRESYGPLLARLQLSSEQTERFFALEMTSVARIMGNHVVELGEPILGYRERHEQLRELLGPAGHDAYLKYAATEEPAHTVVARVAGDVFYTDEPLTAGQSRDLLEFIKAKIVTRNERARIDWSSVMPEAEGRFSPQVVAVLRELSDSDRLMDLQARLVSKPRS